MGITKIDGSGRKEGGEGTEKTIVAAFILATYLEILYFGKKKKNWRNDQENFLVFQKSS